MGIPKPPRLFYCNKCRLYFFTFSQLDKPTHVKCAGHNTRLATNKEIDKINKTNKTSFCYNEVTKNE